ncbi:MAG: hypothetical protein KatS3mg031_0953 [Chitinophagales bacterium]|nr:MAG: hypothetical protein KatS3mg031_0953 [Chitinophagales bacterium]
MRIAYILTLCINIHIVSAQKTPIVFEKSVFDFGEISNWNNPPAIFVFSNRSTSEILFLPTFPAHDVYVELPKGKIPAGAVDTVKIYYFTPGIGEFEKKVSLYINASDDAIPLTVKGKILSLDKHAYISCPGFAPPGERSAAAKQDTVKSMTSAPGFIHDQSSRISQQAAQVTISVRIAEAEIEKDHIEFEEPDEKQEPKQTSPPVPPMDVVAPAIQSPSAPAESMYGSVPSDTLLPENLYGPNNIIFLIDVSASMKKPDKLPLLKLSMINLAHALRNIDRLSIITYSVHSQVMLPSVTANNKKIITQIIDSLTARGYTNGVKGLQTAYEIAEQNFVPDGNNQIILATDGLFNNPGHSEKELFDLVKEKSKNNIILSVIGFGQDKSALRLMKQMAKEGSGSFIRITNSEAARQILIDEIKYQSAFNK